jgi:hypothetical protein
VGSCPAPHLTARHVTLAWAGFDGDALVMATFLLEQKKLWLV